VKELLKKSGSRKDAKERKGLACVKKELRVNGKPDWVWGYINRIGKWVWKSTD
jgi:hypothetical protein